MHTQSHEISEEQRQASKVFLAQLLSCPVVSVRNHSVYDAKATKPLEFKPDEFQDLDKAMARGSQANDAVGQSVLEAANT